MREIKFRGYDTESKRWRYGSYFLKEDITLSPICDDPNEWENDKRANEHHLIIWNGSSDWNLPKPHYQSEVNGDTVGQYTEFHDMNGNEIYTGDIIKWHDSCGNEYIMQIVYSKEWNMQVVWINNCGIGVNQHLADDIEVIGNIYENPELLESEAEE